jgi:hypothetical protein
VGRLWAECGHGGSATSTVKNVGQRKQYTPELGGRLPAWRSRMAGHPDEAHRPRRVRMYLILMP